jgi:hypothetical protein
MMEIEDFARRSDAITKLLQGAFRRYATLRNPAGGISVAHALPGMARELAMIWEAGHRAEADKRIIAKVARIKKLATGLLSTSESLGRAGVSGDMMRALIDVAHAAVYSERAIPKKGRPENTAALQTAEKFKEFYQIIIGPIGQNEDHNFVRTLGEIFNILDFKANPQHYAKLVAAAPMITA